MKKLVYYIDRGNENYERFYEYAASNVDADELYARQLCTYLIKNETEYQLLYTEMAADEEFLILQELRPNKRNIDEKSYLYGFNGIPIEFRTIDSLNQHTFLTATSVRDHWSAIRYLLKDYVQVPDHGLYEVTSTELDEDRGCYVIYVTK